MAIEEINAAGDITSLGGAKLELVRGDTRFDTDTGVNETQRLINEECVTAIVQIRNLRRSWFTCS